ncbi:MAG: hypothetical protein AAF844_00140 [Pseudomonadota bacterium]
MGDVRSLRGDPIAQPGPVPDVVEALEWALERARNGEIVGVAAVMLYRDESTHDIRVGVLNSSCVYGEMFRLASILATTDLDGDG